MIQLSLMVASSCCFAQQPASTPAQALNPFPPPLSILSDTKKFNAVEFGPGNTIEIHQAPKDFTLQDIALSTDGNLLAMVWGSGRTEIRHTADGSLAKQFKALEYGLGFTENDRSFISADNRGDIEIVDVVNGKIGKRLNAELGPRGYGVRAVLYRPDLDWWAYVDGEEGRVVKLSDEKTVLASFGNATDFALSADGKRIWTVGRDAVRVYSVDTWHLEKEWPLRSPTPPTQEPSFSLGESQGGQEFAAVPSVGGLMIYPENTQEKISGGGTAIIDSKDDLMLLAGASMRLMSLNGTPRCQWKQQPYYRRTVSADGRWLAIADTQQVSLWNMSRLVKACK
jgi:hypothetical protein